MTKVVVITGASSGIGLSHAIYLTHLGYTVFGTSRKGKNQDLEHLKQIYIQDHTKWKFTSKKKTAVKAGRVLAPKKIIKNIDSLLKKIRFFEMNVNSTDSVNNAISEMEKEAKKVNKRGIDVLINNVGISYFKSVEDLSIEDWKQSFETNLFSIIRVIKAIIPFMRARKDGQIINTSSLAAYAAIPYQAHYCAAKSAIKLLSEGLYVELKQFNIKVSTVFPSDINTNFNVNMANITQNEEADIQSPEIKQMMENPPVEEESPYYESTKRVWKVIIQNLIVSPPPISISRTVAKIMRKKKPKINYKSGAFSQKLLTFIIQKIAPDKLTYSILPSYFGMK